MVGSSISGTGIGILAEKIEPEDIEKPIIDLDSSTSKIFDQT